MSRHPYGETITVTRQGEPTGEFDDGGNPLLGPDFDFDVTDVAVAPAGSEEDPQALGTWVVTGFSLFLPYGTLLKPSDRITVRGIAGWQVEGDTEASGWRNPFNGRTPGAVVAVRRS